jgi:hypothetical protein
MQTLQKQIIQCRNTAEAALLGAQLGGGLAEALGKKLEQAAMQENLAPQMLCEQTLALLSDSYREVAVLREKCEQAQSILTQLASIERTLMTHRKEFANSDEQSVSERLNSFDSDLQPYREMCGMERSHMRGNTPSVENLRADLEALRYELSTQLSCSTRFLNLQAAAISEETRGVLLLQEAKISYQSHLGALKALSTYYPRGASPEVEAYDLGLLTLDQNAANTATILHEYNEAETGIPKYSGRSPYFRDLQGAKADVRDSNRDIQRLRNLRDVYLRSGSVALGYFANLNCIAAGDTSHNTLFQSTEQASVLNRFPELSSILAGLPQPYLNEATIFHRWRIAFLADNHSEAGVISKALTKKSAESFMVAAMKKYAAGNERDGADFAFSARQQSAVQYPDDPCLYIEAHLLSPLSERDVQSIAKLAPNEVRVWRDVVASHVEGVPDWAGLEAMLGRFEASPSPWMLAASRALELSDRERTQRYLALAHQIAPTLVEPLVCLAALCIDKDSREVLEYLNQAQLLAPHHPAVVARSSQEENLDAAKLVAARARSRGGALPEWDRKTGDQIRAALRDADSVQESLEASDAYGAVHTLLHSEELLPRALHAAIRFCSEQRILVQALIDRAPCKASLWKLSCGDMHDQLSTLSTNSAIGLFASCFRELTLALREIDPRDDYFGGLQKSSLLEASLETARFLWKGLDEVASETGLVQAQPLRSFEKCLGDLLGMLEQEIAPNLQHASSLLELWANDMKALGDSLV